MREREAQERPKLTRDSPARCRSWSTARESHRSPVRLVAERSGRPLSACFPHRGETDANEPSWRVERLE